MNTATTMIQSIELPNGRSGFQVAGGLIFAARVAAERFAAALAAKIRRVAERTVAKVAPVVAKVARAPRAVRLRKAIRKAEALARTAHERASNAWSDRRRGQMAGYATTAEYQIAITADSLARAAGVRLGRIARALDDHIAGAARRQTA